MTYSVLDRTEMVYLTVLNKIVGNAMNRNRFDVYQVRTRRFSMLLLAIAKSQDSTGQTPDRQTDKANRLIWAYSI